MWLLIIFIILMIAYLYIENIYSDDKKTKYHYNKKSFITNQERYFYNIFKELEKELNIIVHPQLNLASIINKSGGKYRNELFRNIDFAIFTQDYENLLFLIEINDKTHKKYDRRKRDNFVKNICSDANIKLITFDTAYSNTKEYVTNRIKNTYIETLNNNKKN